MLTSLYYWHLKFRSNEHLKIMFKWASENKEFNLMKAIVRVTSKRFNTICERKDYEGRR